MDTTFNSKDSIKTLVKEQHFNSTADVMNCMKEMFADVFQETLNAEMDDHLVHNFRNGHILYLHKFQIYSSSNCKL